MPAATMARAWLAAAGEDAVAKVGCLFGDMLLARRAGWTPLKVAQRQFKAYFYYGGAMHSWAPLKFELTRQVGSDGMIKSK